MDSRVVFKETARLAVTAGLAASMTLGSFPVAVFADAAAEPAPKQAVEQEAPKAEEAPAEGQEAPKAEEASREEGFSQEQLTVAAANEVASVPAAEQGANTVAKIGQVEYTSLTAAINAAQSGATVTVTADITEKVVINGKTNLTIDGKGKAFKGGLVFTGTNNNVTVKNAVFTVDQDGHKVHLNGSNTSVSIVDSTFNVPPTANGVWAVLYLEKQVQTLAVSGNTFNVEKDPGKAGSIQFIGFGGGTDARATDVTISGNHVYSSGANGNQHIFVNRWMSLTSDAYAAKNIVVENNDVHAESGFTGVLARNTEKLTVKGNKFYGGLRAVCLYSSDDGGAVSKDITIEGNTFDGQSRCVWFYADSAKDAIIQENTFNPLMYGIDFSKLNVPISVKDNKGTVTYNYNPNGSATIYRDGYTRYYASVGAAVNDAKTGETVKLFVDSTENIVIPENKTVTLDLAGHKLTATGAGKVALTVGKNASVTVKDSSDGQKGSISTTPNVYQFAVALNEASSFTLKSGTISSFPNDYAAITAMGDGAKVSIEGGNVKAGDPEAISAGASKNVSIGISDGTVEASTILRLFQGGTAEVTGGTFTVPANSPVFNSGMGKVTVSAGTFKGAAPDSKYIVPGSGLV